MTYLRKTSIAALALLAAISSRPQSKVDQPETVLVTLHAKPGSEAALQAVLTRHWSTARALNLVRDSPHVTLREAEDGNTTRFIDIFTWRDAAIPDAAPAPIPRALGPDEPPDGSARRETGTGIPAVSVVAP